MCAILAPKNVYVNDINFYYISLGCAIISKDFVLTAAHCIVQYGCYSFYPLKSFEYLLTVIFFKNSDKDNLTSSQIEIVVGTTKWAFVDEIYGVSEIIAHEHYDRLNDLNDIALIRVQPPITFNEMVQPIKYTPKLLPPGSFLQATGWGRINVRLNSIFHVSA